MGRRSRSRRGAGLEEGRSQRWEKKLSRDRGGVRPDFVFLCGGMVILVGIIWGQGSLDPWKRYDTPLGYRGIMAS